MLLAAEKTSLIDSERRRAEELAGPSESYFSEGRARYTPSVASQLSRDIVPSPDEIVSALRVHFAGHNRTVLLLALATLVAAIALWTTLYFLAEWLTLLALVVIRGEDAPLPHGFGVVFATATVCLLLYAWIDRRLTPNDWPRDHKPAREIAEDFLLAIPRTTLAAWSTLTVRQRLTEVEFAQAGAFLARLAAAGRLPMSAAGYDLPDAVERERVLFALRVTRIIDIDRIKGEFVIRLGDRRPELLRLGAADGGAGR